MPRSDVVGQCLALNLSLIPLEPRGKVPAVAWKRYQTEHPGADALEQWFGNGHDFNIGVVTGAGSGVVVVDLDSPAAEQWAEVHLPPTPMRTRTAKGQHLYYRHPGTPVRNSARIRSTDQTIDLDVRGDGGYVVAPGSVHETGARYEMIGSWPDSLDALPVFDPAWLAPDTPPQSTPGGATSGFVASTSPSRQVRRACARSDQKELLSRARAYLRATPPAIQGEGGDIHTFGVVCRIVRGFDLSEADARDVLSEWNQTCVPPWSERELDEKIVSAMKYGTEPVGARAEERIQVRTSAHREQDATDAGRDTSAGHRPVFFANTDSGNAEYFVDRHGHELRYDHQRGRWLLWTPPIWMPDADARARRLAKDAMRQRFRDTEFIDDLDARKHAAKWAITSESRPRLEALLYLAQAEKPIADVGTMWGADPFLLACSPGVVDLKTGRLRDGRQADRLTMQTTVAFDADATCPRFERFLDEVFDGERELVDYMHRVLGYCLTGDTSEQCFWMLYGIGSNGKSTLLRVLTRVLGSYSYTAPFSTFIKDHRPSISNDLAALAGRRFVCASEADENAHLNEGRLKSLTGGDEITARFLNHEFFTYTPTLKLWLAVNHRPVVKDDSHGMWRRVRVIPFTRRFSINRNLESELLAEAAGILAWAVRGCLLWRAEGMRPPRTVLAATTDYEEDSDQLGDFLMTACEQRADASVGATALYKHYEQWADEEGLTVRDRLSATMFGRKVTERFDKQHTERGKVYFGVTKRNILTGLDQ